MSELIVSIAEFIGNRGDTRGIETSKYPEEKKSKSDFLSSGERKGNSLNRSLRYSPEALYDRGHRVWTEGFLEPSGSYKILT